MAALAVYAAGLTEFPPRPGTLTNWAVDGAKVASVSLDFPLPASPVGLWCGGSTSNVVSRFEVIHARPTAFVIMPFSGEYNDVYSQVIRPTCAELGVETIRADDILAPGTVLADVEAQIEDSTFVIADVTAANANVFYEVGYARALRKPLELLALKGTDVPFDIRSQRVRFYESSFAGKSDIEKWLRLDISSIIQQ